ncbi:MAG: DUF4870 domain-containing protein [Cryobacterium sp.]
MTSTPPPDNSQAPAPLNLSDEKMWATLIHIGGVFFYFLPALVGYIVLKDRGSFIRDHARTALNFQLTLLIIGLVGSALTVILIGFVVLLAAWVLLIVFSIMAALAANRGDLYAYPLTIKFIS